MFEVGKGVSGAEKRAKVLITQDACTGVFLNIIADAKDKFDKEEEKSTPESDTTRREISPSDERFESFCPLHFYY